MRKWLMVLGLIAIACPAAGEEPLRLPEVVVIATRLEQEVIKIPQQVSVIERQQIEDLHPNTVLDVLRTVPGIMVRDFNGNGMNASVDMRGFSEASSQHTLVLLDGRRLNPIDMSGVDFSTIPVDSIERIEVIHGASAVLYGDGAIGGVINIITREGYGQPKTTIDLRGGSYESGQVRASSSGSADALSWFGQAHFSGSQGYRDNSESRSRGVGLNLRADPSDTFSFLLDTNYDESHYSLPGALSDEQMNIDRQHSDNPYDWASRQVFNIRGQARKDLQQAGVFSTDIYYRYLDAESEMVSWGDQQTESTTHNFGLQPKYIVEYSLGGLDARSTMGLDYNFWKVTSDTISPFSSSRAEYEANTIAGYLLEELSLTDQLLFSLGGRVHYAKFDIDNTPQGGFTNSESADETQYAWTAGLTWNFDPKGKVYASIGRTFRYPLVDEYVSWGTFNPDLEAEYGMDYELGAEYTFACGLTTSLNLYWMDMKQEISYNPMTRLNENLDATVHRGFDLGFKLPLGEKNQHHLFASLGYQDVYFNDGAADGDRVPLVPDWTASLGGQVEVIENLRLKARLNFYGERYYSGDNQNQGDKLSAYATVDLGADYTWQIFTLYMQVQNLFNKYYSDYAYYSNYSGFTSYSHYPQPGTQIWAGLKVEF